MIITNSRASIRYHYLRGQGADIKTSIAKFSFNTKILLFLTFSLLFRITILTRRRPNDDFAIVDSFALIEIVMVGLSLFFLLFSHNLKAVLNNISRSSANILLIYSILSILSALWSPLPSYSFFRAIQVTSQFLVIFIVLYEFNSFESAEYFVLKVASLFMVINVLGQFKLIGYNISLPLMHSNTYSNSAAMIFCYCFNEYYFSNRKDRNRLRKYGFVGLCGIILGTSATSNIAALLSILFSKIIFYRSFSIHKLILVLLIIFPIAVFSSRILDRLVSDLILAGKNSQAVSTMSGRQYIWRAYLKVAKENPILGHGFAIATRVGDLRVNTAHNILLAIALDLGLVGLFLFVWGGQRLVRECIRPGPPFVKGRLGVLGVFIVALVACQSTPFIATHWHAPNAVFVLFLGLHVLFLRSQNVKTTVPPSSVSHRPRSNFRYVRSQRVPVPYVV